MAVSGSIRIKIKMKYKIASTFLFFLVNVSISSEETLVVYPIHPWMLQALHNWNSKKIYFHLLYRFEFLKNQYFAFQGKIFQSPYLLSIFNIKYNLFYFLYLQFISNLDLNITLHAFTLCIDLILATSPFDQYVFNNKKMEISD